MTTSSTMMGLCAILIISLLLLLSFSHSEERARELRRNEGERGRERIEKEN
jgi:hypothetical protein